MRLVVILALLTLGCSEAPCDINAAQRCMGLSTPECLQFDRNNDGAVGLDDVNQCLRSR